MLSKNFFLLLVVVLSVLPICMGSVDLPPQLNLITFLQPPSDVDLSVSIQNVAGLSRPNVAAKVNGKNDDSVMVIEDYGSDVSAQVSIEEDINPTTTGSTAGTTRGTTGSPPDDSVSGANSFGLSYVCVLLSVFGLFSTSRKGAALIVLIAFVAMVSMPSHADVQATKTVKIDLNLPIDWSVQDIPVLPFKEDIIVDTDYRILGEFQNAHPSCVPNDPDWNTNGATCEHTLCQVNGIALSANCSSCVSAICTVNPFCCTDIWDADCVFAVFANCNPDRCCV